MESSFWFFITLSAGIVLGIAGTTLTVLLRNRGKRLQAVRRPSLPAGVDEMLLAIDSVGVVLDFSHNVLRASPGAARLGLLRGSALVSAEMHALVDQVQKTGQPVSSQLDIQHEGAAPTATTLAVRVAPLGVRYSVLLARDLTETKQLEATRADFVANVGHELKTPIGAIRLLTEAILTAPEDEALVERFAGKLLHETERLAALTGDLLHLSRLQAAVEPDELAPVDIWDVIEQSVANNTVIAAEKGVEVVLGKPGDIVVEGDRSQLISAVSNLVNNAINYSPTGTKVGIGMRVVEDTVEIAVTDRGVGIPVEDQERLFERFYRVSHSRNRVSGGTGLGLSIVKHAVRLHGGEVKLWSQPNRGSTFTICLPRLDTMVIGQGEK